MPFVLLDLPNGINLHLPLDYARFCGGDPVRILDEYCDIGVGVRWDEHAINFMGERGGVGYRRSAIFGSQVNNHERVMAWYICTLRIKIRDPGPAEEGCGTSLLVFETYESNVAAFEQFVRNLRESGVPV